MKKLLIALLLAVSSTSAMAAWIVINEGDDHINYVDPATIRKSGTTVKMWSMIDYKTVQKSVQDGYLSMKYQNEYDCRNETMTSLTTVVYSDNRGDGAVVYSNSDRGMPRPVVPETASEVQWKIACGKR